jgi:hypothetical protein
VAREVVARAEEGSKEGEQGRSGGHPSRRWSDSGDTAATMRCPALAAGRAEQSSTCSRKKKRGKGSGGPVWKFQESQGTLGKVRFPTDLEV